MNNVHCLEQDLYLSTDSSLVRCCFIHVPDQIVPGCLPAQMKRNCSPFWYPPRYGASTMVQVAQPQVSDTLTGLRSSSARFRSTISICMCACVTMVTSLEISKWVGLLVYPLAFELHDQKVGGAACRLDCFWVDLCARNQGKCVYLWTSIPRSVS